MNETRESPFTFRLSTELERPFGAALATLGWTKTKLVNEALEIALPIIMERQAARFQAANPTTAQAGAAAAAAAQSIAKRKRSKPE